MKNKTTHDSFNEPNSIFEEVQELATDPPPGGNGGGGSSFVTDPPPGGNGGGGSSFVTDPPPGGNGGGGRRPVNAFSFIEDDNSVTKR